MKRILFVIMMSVLAFTSHAQINILGESGKIETLSSVRAGVVNLRKHDAHIYLSMKTNNRFDDLLNVYLGTTKEEALKSLDDLVTIIDDRVKGENVYINNKGKACRITKEGNNYIVFSMSGYAGEVGVMKSELLKFKKALLEYEAE